MVRAWQHLFLLGDNIRFPVSVPDRPQRDKYRKEVLAWLGGGNGNAQAETVTLTFLPYGNFSGLLEIL